MKNELMTKLDGLSVGELAELAALCNSAIVRMNDERHKEGRKALRKIIEEYNLSVEEVVSIAKATTKRTGGEDRPTFKKLSSTKGSPGESGAAVWRRNREAFLATLSEVMRNKINNMKCTGTYINPDRSGKDYHSAGRKPDWFVAFIAAGGEVETLRPRAQIAYAADSTPDEEAEGDNIGNREGATA